MLSINAKCMVDMILFKPPNNPEVNTTTNSILYMRKLNKKFTNLPKSKRVNYKQSKANPTLD